MTAPELKRYWAMQGPIKEAIDGEFVYYRDVQAAIAAAMNEAVSELKAFLGPVDVPRTALCETRLSKGVLKY